MIFRRVDDGEYVATDPQFSIEFHLDHLRRERHELVGELRVVAGFLGSEGVLSHASFNFSSAQARSQRARLLAEQAQTKNGDVPWLKLLEETCQLTLKAERTGDPGILLRAATPATADDTFTIDGFTFPKKHPTIAFGDGSTAKSLHALRDMGELATRGVKTGFADWELDVGEHRPRFERLFGRDMPDVRYIRCDRPLVHEIDRLRRWVRDHKLEYVVLDSVAFGTDGPPEAAESAMAYMRAVRQLGIGTRLIAHITKSGDQMEHRPFGSNYWHHSARSTWFTKLAHTSTDGRLQTIGLYNRKSNLGPLLPAVAFAIDFDPDRTTFTRVDVADIGELAEGLPMWQRLKSAVSRGPQTLATLAEELDAKPDTVKKAVQRHPQLFTRVTGKDGVQRIALQERRAS